MQNNPSPCRCDRVTIGVADNRDLRIEVWGRVASYCHVFIIRETVYEPPWRSIRIHPRIAKVAFCVNDKGMKEAPKGYATVFETKHRDKCLELRLVLVAMGIAVQMEHQDGRWFLFVKNDDLEVATSELDTYRRENPDRSRKRTAAVPIYGGAVTGVLIYAASVVLVSVLNAQRVLGQEWLWAGRMHAGSVMAGQWWRTVTALTLHLDVEHLISNLLFGAVFGFLAGRVLGGGVAWLAIVIAGALGNFMNAVVQTPNHTSIGASTAVFAALGVIVAHALRPRASVEQKPLMRWSPLIGGVLLLSLTGIGGERTDVVAHVTGFLAGLLIGWAGCRFPNHWLASHKLQSLAGLGTILTLVFAWLIALINAAE